SFGLSKGTHGSGALVPAANSARHHHSATTTTNTVCRRVRHASKRVPRGTVSHRQRHNDTAASSSHGRITTSSDQPAPRSKRPASHSANSDSTDGHSSHQTNCARLPAGPSPTRRQARLRTPSRANTSHA